MKHLSEKCNGTTATCPSANKDDKALIGSEWQRRRRTPTETPAPNQIKAGRKPDVGVLGHICSNPGPESASPLGRPMLGWALLWQCGVLSLTEVFWLFRRMWGECVCGMWACEEGVKIWNGDAGKADCDTTTEYRNQDQFAFTFPLQLPDQVWYSSLLATSLHAAPHAGTCCFVYLWPLLMSLQMASMWSAEVSPKHYEWI